MKNSATLSRYLGRTYIVHFALLLLGLMAVVYLFDTVELIRRAAKRDDVSLILVLQMGLLKLPEVTQMLFPFAVLFSAMFSFFSLNKRLELIVVRAAGFSAWQFMAPVLVVAVALGILQMTIFNPLGAILVGKYEQLEGAYLKRYDSQIALFQEGLWLRQNSDEGYVIIHAPKIEQHSWVLQRPMVLFFDAGDHFLKRVSAQRALLKPGRWMFEDAQVYETDLPAAAAPVYVLPTELTIQDVEESFASPATMSFWQLPGHIQTLEDTGFDASRLRIHYHGFWAQPLMLAAMVLLAAAVSMRPPRQGRVLRLVATGIFMGVVVFFLSNFLQALGASQQIPVLLAAWAPAVISFLFGLSVIMNLEDG